MAAENKPSELTTTLHLGVRPATDSSSHRFEELLETLSPEDRKVIEQIQGSAGRKSMVWIMRGANKGSRFLITEKGTTIGRSPSSEIFLDDITVSRSHATITSQDGSFVLKDAGSLNGTYINNSSVEEHLLVTGDEFQIGKFHLVFIGSK